MSLQSQVEDRHGRAGGDPLPQPRPPRGHLAVQEAGGDAEGRVLPVPLRRHAAAAGRERLAVSDLARGGGGRQRRGQDHPDEGTTH